MSSSQEIFEFGRIASRQDAVVAALVFLGFAGFVAALYRRDVRGLKLTTAGCLLAFRLGALAVIGWAALDPRIVVETTVVREPKVVLLVDRSRSMEVADVPSPISGGARISRWKQMTAALVDSGRVDEWGVGRDLQIVAFGKNTTPLADAASLRDVVPSDDETRLGGAVLDAFGDAEKRPAAIVVASDGGLNGGPTLDETVASLKEARVPVHAVVLGAERQPFNVRIAEVRLPLRAFRGSDPVSGAAVVEIVGEALREVDVVVEARRTDGAQAAVALGKQRVKFDLMSTAQVPVSFPPQQVGRWEISARVEPLPNELRTDDNRASAVVEVVDRKTKVLLASGSASREYQFLRSVLFRDASVELSVWLQPGRSGVSQDAFRLLTAFPKDRAELFKFDAIVAIDVDWRALDSAAQQNFADWVSSQAAGAIFVAGSSHWGKLDPASPIAAVSPVVPRRTVLETVNAPALQLHPLLFTREGAANRSFSLNDNPTESSKVWGSFGGFFWSADVDRLKPGAVLLATTQDPTSRGEIATTQSPAIASQFFGAGRALYIGSAELWRLRRIDERLYERLWTQLVRWVSEGRLLRGSERGGLLVDDRQIAARSDLTVKAYLLDQQFKPLLAAKIAASATTAAGPREFMLDPIAGQSGRYQGVLTAPAAGPVKVMIPVPGGGVIEESFTVRESRLEWDDIRVRRDVLERLAAASGGRVFTPAQTTELQSTLPTNVESTVLVSPPRALWDRWWWVALFVGLLAVEWTLRKLLRLA